MPHLIIYTFPKEAAINSFLITSKLVSNSAALIQLK